ncbi:reticulon-4-interacting protein 1 homolog, mitochondrial-like, partial [Eurosta solidaginis]|uniref:reticulon-4-interacting protein 1 homolog, mitochondrial-like n=1 Tax=Eurosta solidaginis TaxID=178769 RepID=UPI003530D9EC
LAAQQNKPLLSDGWKGRVSNPPCTSFYLSKAPNALSDEQAASVLYAGLTAWSGLYITGGFGGACGVISSSGGGENRRVLVLGGSGSVGSMAIQILKSQKATVISTCRDDAIELVKNLGADYVVDYNNRAQLQSLHSYAPFDIVLDCTGQAAKKSSEIDLQFRQYITFSSPLLHNVDHFGVGTGMIKNVSHFFESNKKTLTKSGGLLKYGFFMPVQQGIEFLTRITEKKQILPLIDSCFPFHQLQRGFEKVQCGHLRGKVVISVT